MGRPRRGLAELLRHGTCYEWRHQVGEACCRRGGVAGAEPPHKGGPNRPDRPEKQWLVVSGQRRPLHRFKNRVGEWLWLRCRRSCRKVRTHFEPNPLCQGNREPYNTRPSSLISLKSQPKFGAFQARPALHIASSRPVVAGNALLSRGSRLPCPLCRLVLTKASESGRICALCELPVSHLSTRGRSTSIRAPDLL